MPNFRQNVAAILINSSGEILIGERIKQPGAWQFPQGGIDLDESSEQALFREVYEELGIKPECYNIISKKEGYSYNYPKKIQEKKGWTGQQQIYFLCRVADDSINFNLTLHTQEFRTTRWIQPKVFDLDWLPSFKRDTYSKVLKDFFVVSCL